MRRQQEAQMRRALEQSQVDAAMVAYHQQQQAEQHYYHQQQQGQERRIESSAIAPAAGGAGGVPRALRVSARDGDGGDGNDASLHGYPAADMEDMGPLDMEQAGGAYQNHPLELEQQYTVKAGCGVGGAKREHAERALRGREGEGDAEGG
jgi:hypothetical protein